jgi:NAD(P)-dependent dehydrogenase (short-subunit alcohol dehydrogenase family)
VATQQMAEGNKVFGTFNKTNSSNNGLRLYPLEVRDEHLDTSFAPDVVDGLVYCPGSVSLKPFARIKPEDFLNDYELQLIGAVKVIQSLLPKLKNAGNPSIVLFSTVAVQTGFNFH